MAGGLCGYSPHAVELASGTYGFLGMPNIYVLPGMGPSGTSANLDTTACLPAGDSLTIHATDTGELYQWDDGSSQPTRIVGSYGTYWVKAGSGCVSTTDTIKVLPLYDSVYEHSDTVVCVNSELDTCTLTAPAGSYYQWYDGTTDSTHTVRESGVYLVLYTVGCTRYFDTIHATFEYYPEPITGPDKVCLGDTVTLSDLSPGGVWSSSAPTTATAGAANGVIDGVSAGVAVISYAVPPGCASTRNITVMAPPCISGIPGTAEAIVDFSITPNPASDACVISWTGPFAPGAVLRLCDLSGKLIRELPVTRMQTVVPVADLPAGMYLCNLDVHGSTICRKLAVLR